jgi:hypothetical protein
MVCSSRLLSPIYSSPIPSAVTTGISQPLLPASSPRFFPAVSPQRSLPAYLSRFIPPASAPQFVPALFHPNYSSSEGKIIFFEAEDRDSDFLVFIFSVKRQLSCLPLPIRVPFFSFISFDFDSFGVWRFRLFDSIFLFWRHSLFVVSEFVCNVLLSLLVLFWVSFISVGVILLFVSCWDLIPALIGCRYLSFFSVRVDHRGLYSILGPTNLGVFLIEWCSRSRTICCWLCPWPKANSFRIKDLEKETLSCEREPASLKSHWDRKQSSWKSGRRFTGNH